MRRFVVRYCSFCRPIGQECNGNATCLIIFDLSRNREIVNANVCRMCENVLICGGKVTLIEANMD